MTYSQEKPKPVPPLEHEKRFYSGKDGKLYGALSLPVYLHISSTPEAAGSYRLHCKDSPMNTNPMFLKEGLNIIKKSPAIHPQNKSILKGMGIRFEVYGDGTPPVTTAMLTNAPKYVKENNVYFGKGLVLKLIPDDTLSGVQEVYLSVDGRVFKPLRSPFTIFTGDAGNYLRYYSVDNVGNAEKPKETIFYLDVSPPQTQVTVNGDHKENILSPRAAVSLQCRDNLSGVKSIVFQIDKGKKTNYSEPITINHLSEGEHTLVYFGHDHVNNLEEPHTYTFYYDKSPPELSISISGEKHKKEGTFFVSCSAKIKMDAVDNKAGTAAIRYCLDAGEEKIYAAPFLLPGRGGVHRITYSTIDQVDNQSQKQAEKIYLDLTPPETEYELSGSYFRHNNTLIIHKHTRVYLTSIDMEAGLKEIKYQVTPWHKEPINKKFLRGSRGQFFQKEPPGRRRQKKEYTGPLSFEEAGEYKLTYFAVDRVNNREKEKVLSLLVDNSPRRAGFHIPQSKHPKQWFINEKRGLTGPVDLPFYLIISTSAGDKGTFLLDLKKLSAETGQPITFKKGGVNYLRLFTGKKSETFQVKIDAVPPMTRAIFTGAPNHSQGEAIYFGPGLTLSFAGEDNQRGISSGYKKTLISINGSPFFTYKNPLQIFSRERIYKCRYYSVDGVGNAEPVQEIEFTVDTTPPQTQREVKGPFFGIILSANSIISLSASDNLSGVKSIYYYYDDKKEKTYGKSLTGRELGLLSEGKHTLHYFAVDNVGNREEPHEFTFYLDHASPSVGFKIIGDRHMKGDILFVSGRSRIRLPAEDRRAKVRAIKYQINGGQLIDYTAAFSLPKKSGRYTVSYTGIDAVGNVKYRQAKTLFLDLAPPGETNTRLLGPGYRQENRLFVSSQTKIELLSSDGQSGLAGIYYRIDNSQEKKYSQPFAISAAGAHKVEYFALDRVNNRNKTKQLVLMVDNQPPTLQITYNVTPKRDPENGVLVFPKYVLIFLTAKDADTEVDRITYRLNEGKEILYRNPLSNFEKNKVITLRALALDRLKNTSEVKIKFKIE